MNEQFTFEAEPFRFYTEFGFEQEIGLDQFTPAVPLLDSWRTVGEQGAVYALYKNNQLMYIGKTGKLGGLGNRLYFYQWYGSKLACGLSQYTVRYIFISDSNEWTRVERRLRAKYRSTLTNAYELEA